MLASFFMSSCFMLSSFFIVSFLAFLVFLVSFFMESFFIESSFFMESCWEGSCFMESFFISSWAKKESEAAKIHASAKLPKIFFIRFSWKKSDLGCPAGLHLQAEMGCAVREEVTRKVHIGG